MSGHVVLIGVNKPRLQVYPVLMTHPWVSPVQSDAAEVQDGGGGQQDVQSGPHQAEGVPVDPVLRHQLDGSERHHQHRDQQVRKGQGHDEVVGLYLPEGGDMYFIYIYITYEEMELKKNAVQIHRLFSFSFVSVESQSDWQ